MKIKLPVTERRCTKCGKTLSIDQFYRQGDGYQQPCKACRKAMNEAREYSEADRLRDYRRQHRSPGCGGLMYTVLSDPDEQAGFPRGARLPATQIGFMLEMGSFTPGTRLQNPRQRVLKVIGIGKQRMIEE